MKQAVYFVSIILVIGLAFCTIKNTTPAKRAITQFSLDVDSFKMVTDSFVAAVKQRKPVAVLQQLFLKGRYYYKKTEFLTEYYFPATAKAINGPALLEVEPDNPKYPIEPTGFQVIEEFVYSDTNNIDYEALTVQSYTLQTAIVRLQKHAEELIVTDAHLWDAVRLEIFRIITLGITGFDSPIAQSSLPENIAALNSLKFYTNLYTATNTNNKIELHSLFDQAISYLSKPTNTFDNFDRATFISKHINPLCVVLKSTQQNIQIPFFSESRLLSSSATTLFDSTAWNTWYFSANTTRLNNHIALANLGELLFYEPKLSGNNLRSCADCHNPQKSFTDGLAKNKSFDGKKIILRNTPTIYFSALQAAQFADTRVFYLEDQAKQVVENPEEMHGNLKAAIEKIKNEKKYHQLLKAAFGNKPVSEIDLQVAIAAYIRTKSAFNTRFDQFMQGNNSILLEEEQLGFNLFMGKAKCGTCHFMPLFNGTVPPAYTKIETEVLGVPAKNQPPYKIDDDLGKYNLVVAEPYLHAFKTPTVRNTAETAPYMHNGSIKNLNDLMAFYNKGGGLGLGIDVPNQTLPSDSLRLTTIETNAIIAFLKSLSNQ
jgi:cytochrome c peroxidase